MHLKQLLGGIALSGKVGRTPRRLEILGQSRQSLVGYAGPAHRHDPIPAPEAPAIPAEKVRAPAETANQETPRPTSERSYLKLVIDNI